MTVAGVGLDDLGTRRLTWHHLAVLIAHLPPTSALERARHPEHRWGLSEQLLALVADLIAVSNWQRAAGKGRRPRPIPRPGVGPATTRIGKDKLSIRQLEAALAAPRRPRKGSPTEVR